MNFIILGDKFNKRMKSRGCMGLMSINNKPIVQHQIECIKKYYPQAKIIYVYGFEHKKFNSFVEKSNIKDQIYMLYNSNYEKYNQTYSLSLAKNFLNNKCFIISGDNPLNNRIFQNFKDDYSQVFIDRKNNKAVGCIIDNDMITNIAYDLDNYISDIYYLCSDDALFLQEILIHSSNLNNCFLFEIINKLIDHNKNIRPFYINEKNKYDKDTFCV